MGKESEMNEGQRMIEEARLRHLAGQTSNPRAMTFYDSVEKIYGKFSDIEKDAQLRYNDSCRDLFGRLGAKEYYRVFYSVMAVKYISIGIANLACDLLASSNVTDTKDIVKNFRQGVVIFYRDLKAMPRGTENLMERLADWWMADGLKEHIDHQHYAYANIVMKGGINSNVADLAAWLFTIRDLAQAIIKHDDEIVPMLNQVMHEHHGYSYRNDKDVAYTLERFSTALIKNLFGKDIVPKDQAVVTGRNAFLTQIKLYDAFTNLCCCFSHEAVSESHRQCPAERCHLCELYPCKTYKSVNRQMQNYIEDK